MITDGRPLSRAELASITRTKAREHAIDQLRRTLSALNAALNDEPSSARSTALHSIRGRVVAMIAELRAL